MVGEITKYKVRLLPSLLIKVYCIFLQLCLMGSHVSWGVSLKN